MIKQLPEEFTSIILYDGLKTPHNDSFKELRRKVREIIDQTNAQYEAIQRIIGRQHRHLSDDHKKPRSTNIELRQKIAVLELNNNVLQQKCEDYLGKIIEAKQALELFCSEDVSYHPGSKIDATHARKALDQINRWKD